MAVIFNTNDPSGLLASFKAAIKSGSIETWEASADGKYYTHKADDWAKKAWFKPVVNTANLTFQIIKPQNTNITSLVYAYYHGHLIQAFLTHFDDKFSLGSATAMPATGDVVK